jgi:DMSO/TMAO reductase YedYZ molybdopterin-dependent catalytic subunit
VNSPSRRRFLSTLGLAGVAAASGVFEQLLAGRQLTGLPGGQLMGLAKLGRFDGRPQPPLGTLLGGGLDARQFNDLSVLTAERLITPTRDFFIRTATPPALPPREAWQITLGGLVRREREVPLAALGPLTRPMGTHIMECSGNNDPANFGLLSAASWHGAPIGIVLDRAEALPEGRRIRVTGIDDDSQVSQTSVPGAGWVFLQDDLKRAGAFLATGMNGGDLPSEHGAPVRLVVPNWYGCTCIKWVTRLDRVGDDEPATSQMREFAARTHQRGMPELARDYEPAVIDLAALPVRVERWRVDGQVVYRVVGVRWGGTVSAAALTIRFKHTQPFMAVEHCPPSEQVTTWSLWSHTWRPESPGRYQIALAVSGGEIRTRRLDLFFYTREVEIDVV